MIAKRPPSRPSTSQISHSGLVRSSRWENSRPGEARSCSSPPGVGQRGVAHVVARVEVRVVDPHRAPLAERHVRELLAVARHEMQARLDRVDELLVAGRLSLEDQHRRHVHVRAAALEVQEAGIEGGQAVAIGHVPILTRRRPLHNVAQIV